MTKPNPKKTTLPIPQMSDDSASRIALSRQRIHANMTLIVNRHEQLYDALVATHPDLAAILQETHQSALQVEASAVRLAQQAEYYNKLAEELITVAHQFASERDRIIAAIDSRDTDEETFGLNQFISEITEQYFGFGAEHEFNRLEQLLRKADVECSHFIDWLYNADNVVYSEFDRAVIASEAEALANWIRNEENA